jgi:hypothetical protein
MGVVGAVGVTKIEKDKNIARGHGAFCAFYYVRKIHGG